MSKAVVLIENQMSVRRMLRFAMKLQDFRVVEVTDSAAVPAALDRTAAQLLVVGVESAAAGGECLVEQLRRGPAPRELPILLVGDEHLRPQWDLRAIGNCAWLNKPFRVGELNGLVETLVGRDGRAPAR